MQDSTRFFSQDQHRVGMYKNHRIGKVKFYQSRGRGKSAYILVDILEYCLDQDGSPYWATYNLHLEVGDKFDSMLSRDSVGQWFNLGFYIQSYRIKDTPHYDTVLKMKHLEPIPQQSDIIEVYLKNNESITVSAVAASVSKQLSNQLK
jgi:hypothetical protein